MATNHDEHITARVRTIIASTPSQNENGEKEGVLKEGAVMGTVGISLEPDEQKIAQLLTRDAWSYFSSPTELPNRAPVRSIPGMPRDGHFVLPEDPQILSYYLTFAGTYLDELECMGWTQARYHDTCESFLSKIERATGLHRRAPIPAPDLRAAS